MDIDVEEELNERLNGEDFYDGGDGARYFYDTIREFKLERSRVLLGADGIEKADEGGMNYMLLHSGYTMDPDEVNVPKVPYDWVEPSPNTSKREPNFDKVDNPGRWIILSYYPVFASGAKGSQYKANCIPAGCHPVPPKEGGATIRTYGGWNVSTRGGRRGETRMS